MAPVQELQLHVRSLLRFAVTLQYSVKDWIYREVIDDDPYDEEALRVQRMIENERRSNLKLNVLQPDAELRGELLIIMLRP